MKGKRTARLHDGAVGCTWQLHGACHDSGQRPGCRRRRVAHVHQQMRERVGANLSIAPACRAASCSQTHIP